MFACVPVKLGVKMLELGDNSGDVLTLSLLLRKTSIAKVSAKYKYLAMQSQFNDQKRQPPSVKEAANIEAARKANFCLQQMLEH